MKIVNRSRKMFESIGPTITRFPLAMFFLLAATAFISYSITDTASDMNRVITTFIVGAWAAMVAQIIYERFYSTVFSRLLLYGGAIVFDVLFYVLIAANGLEGIQDFVRTSLLLSALSVAFVWVPSIRSNVKFHHTLLAGFRASFLAFLFTLVLMIGVSLLLGAIDQLLFGLPTDTYFHALNPIYSFIGPLLFLTWIPRYPGKWLKTQNEEEQSLYIEDMEKATTPPKSLEWLLSYIVIPLIAIFTVILVAYLLLNISGDFWTDNLLEPMLVSYTTIGILVYLLASTLNNAFAKQFIRWYPKVLVPLVLFQTIASFLRMREIGLTHGRYFTLMAGIFTIIAGIIFILFYSKRNSWIGALLLVFLVVSITPPVDAFTVSRNYYIRQLETTLERNDMLENGQVIAGTEDSISEADKIAISQSYRYLNRMNELDEVEWLENGSWNSHEFVNLFGFYPVNEEDGQYDDIPDYRSASIPWVRGQMTYDVQGFDRMTQFYFDGYPNQLIASGFEFEKEGEMFEVLSESRGEQGVLLIRRESGEILAEMDLQDAFEEVLSRSDSYTNEVSMEEATVSEETEEAMIEITLLNISQYEETPSEYNGEIVIKVGVR